MYLVRASDMVLVFVVCESDVPATARGIVGRMGRVLAQAMKRTADE